MTCKYIGQFVWTYDRVVKNSPLENKIDQLFSYNVRNCYFLLSEEFVINSKQSN